MNTLKRILVVTLALMPLLGLADYQYDPASRLATLQSTYPGGVEGLYIFCTDKFSQKLAYLNNLGLELSDDTLKQETYNFLGRCIYGERDYQQSQCVGRENCTAVDLPLDLSTLKHLSGADKVSNPASPSTNSLLANLY